MSDIVACYGVTPQQAEFVRRILEGLPPTDAAEQSGYGRDYGSRLLRLPQIAVAIHQEISRKLVTEVAPLAMSVAIDLVRDKDSGARVRADLSLKLLQMAGHGVDKSKTNNPDKPLSEMNPDELRAFIDRNQAEIDRLEQELASRAKDVSAPTPATIDAKPLAYLD